MRQTVSKEMLEAEARKGPAFSQKNVGDRGPQGHNVLDFPGSGETNAQRADNPIPTGQRNTALTSLAGTMRRRGFGEEAMYAALLVENRQRCDPPLPDDEVRRIAKRWARPARRHPVRCGWRGDLFGGGRAGGYYKAPPGCRRWGPLAGGLPHHGD